MGAWRWEAGDGWTGRLSAFEFGGHRGNVSAKALVAVQMTGLIGVRRLGSLKRAHSWGLCWGDVNGAFALSRGGVV